MFYPARSCQILLIFLCFKHIVKANKQADSQAQNVQKFTLLLEDFTVANGMMTSTLKLRRAEITKKYSSEIEKMY